MIGTFALMSYVDQKCRSHWTKLVIRIRLHGVISSWYYNSITCWKESGPKFNLEAETVTTNPNLLRQNHKGKQRETYGSQQLDDLHSTYVTLRKKCPYSDFFWPLFFRIRTEYGDLLRFQSECRIMRTRKAPNKDNFYAV